MYIFFITKANKKIRQSNKSTLITKKIKISMSYIKLLWRCYISVIYGTAETYQLLNLVITVLACLPASIYLVFQASDHEVTGSAA